MVLPANAVHRLTGLPYPSEKAARLAAANRADLKGQGYEPARVGGGWVLVLPAPLDIPRELMSIGIEARRGRDGIGVERVRIAVDPVLVQWPEADEPLVEVVASVAELPREIRDAVDEPDVEGLYVPESRTTYLLADRIFSTDHARRVLAHQLAAHVGLDGLVEGDVDDKAAARLRAGDLAGRPVKDLVAAVRRGLRRLGVRLSFDHREVQDIVERATYQREGFT